MRNVGVKTPFSFALMRQRIQSIESRFVRVRSIVLALPATTEDQRQEEVVRRSASYKGCTFLNRIN